MAAGLNRILCVEDEADIQAVARIALETVGNFTVTMCSSGTEALDVIEKFEPDLVLLDVMMPGMDGPSTLKAIREMPMYQSIPIIFMTAKVMESDREHYRSIGAAGIIAKPFDPMTLANQINEIWTEQNGG